MVQKVVSGSFPMVTMHSPLQFPNHVTCLHAVKEIIANFKIFAFQIEYPIEEN